MRIFPSPKSCIRQDCIGLLYYTLPWMTLYCYHHTHNSIKLLTLFSVLKMHFSPRENELWELMMPKLISPHAYDEEDKRQIPNLKPRQDCKGFESYRLRNE